MQENTEALVVAGREIGLEVNAGKTKNMVMSQDQHAVKNHNKYIYIGNKSFESMEHFKYLETSLTNQNSVHEENQSTLQSRNACCHSVQNLLSSSLLSKTMKIKIQRTVICLLF